MQSGWRGGRGVPVFPADASNAALTRPKGTGASHATLLSREGFYRPFRDRRALAVRTGLMPAPRASGDGRRGQRIGPARPARIRAQHLEMAWRWARFQPVSAVSRWFEARTEGARGRIRRERD